MSHVQVGSAGNPTRVNRGWAVTGIALLFMIGLPFALWPVLGANVPLGTCGLGVLRFDDRSWTVLPADAFAPADAPRWWQGHGVVIDLDGDRLVYRDFSGTRLSFTPGSSNPTGC